MKELYLAGGPYYGIQEVFSRIYGVTETVAGFANSGKENLTKKEVADGNTGAVECVKVTYNPKKIDIGSLLSIFFTIINPYTDGVQGKCEGPQYKTGIYFTSNEDIPQITYYVTYIQNRGTSRQMSESCLIMNDVQKNIPPKVHTEVKKLENFYEAPEEEQHFLKKHPETYSPIDIKLLEEAGTFDMTF